jgi:flagellar biosynthetic protein FliP
MIKPLAKTVGRVLGRAALLALGATIATVAGPSLAAAQAIDLNLGTGGGLTDRVVQLVGLLTVLSLAPSIVMMTTSFVRITIGPLLAHKMELPAAFTASAQPVKAFMLSQVDRDDLGMFIRLSKTPKPATAMQTPLTVVTPAFMISELKRAFQMGFLLFIPFLVIDLVVASVLMSMGMMMLPPATISLPFKLIFFVLVDGWGLVCSSLVESFHHAAVG